MKTIKVLSTLFALMLLPLAANAVPSLQLDCDPCTYDDVTEDSVAESATFTLAAIVTENGQGGAVDAATDEFFISIAITGLGSGDAITAQGFFANLLITGGAGTTAWAQADGGVTEYGNPPTGDTHPDEISNHGIFDAWFVQISLNDLVAGGFATRIDCNTYDVQYDEGFVTAGEGSSCYLVSFDRSGLDSTVTLHFDLYTLDDDGGRGAFAPYSHDVTSVPEPGTLSLLGLGLLALGLGRRRREIA